MQLELNITKSLRSGGDEFLLRSQFATSDDALVLFGPSGSGKTLTLQAISGMLTPDEGFIRFNGKVFFDSGKGINVPTRERRVGYVFQDYALFPHLTVRENIRFGLKPLFGRVTAKDKKRVDELIKVFGLSAVASRKPAALSGGQQQRTALARALATSPELLLLDEPFSALDQPLRVRMREEVAKCLANFDTPLIMVTHDSDDVEAFAKSIVVYRNGHVEDIHSAASLSTSNECLSETLLRQAHRAYS